MSTSLQGTISIVAPTYCGIVFVLQLLRSNEFQASKPIITLSNLNILLMAFATTSVALMYYSPTLWGDGCHCHILWSSAVVIYVLSIYSFKAIYVMKMGIINSANDSLGVRAPQSVTYVKVIAILLILSSLACVILCIFLTEATCFQNTKGFDDGSIICIPDFDDSIIYLALCMLLVDGVLFTMFCCVLYRMLSMLGSTEENNRIPVEVKRTFVVQFILTIFAMSSCAVDAVFQLIIYDPNGSNADICLVIFSIDCVIVTTCNFLTIPETRRMFATAYNFICNCKPRRNMNSALNSSNFSIEMNDERNNVQRSNANSTITSEQPQAE